MPRGIIFSISLVPVPLVRLGRKLSESIRVAILVGFVTVPKWILSIQIGGADGGNECGVFQRMLLTAAGAFPARFAAVASFHGGNLAADKPDSPHQFLKNITRRVYVAGAIEDASFPEEQKIRLEKALTDARVNHVVETYAGARHGFAVPDLPVFDKGAAERHWTALSKLFQETLAIA